MTVRAMQAGLRIAEVPSLEMPRRSGKSNLHAIRDGIRVLRTVLRDHRSGLCRIPRAGTIEKQWLCSSLRATRPIYTPITDTLRVRCRQ